VSKGRKLDSVATGAGWTVTGTVMELRLPAPLAPGAKVTLKMAWNYRVPPDGAPRGGQDRETYLLSYWYPQMAVYDDVNGWQADQYLGNSEFYMGYADYDVALTVPAGWLVASTGELQNAAEVLTPAVRERLAKARSSATVTSIVPDSARGPGKATLAGTGDKLTWRFSAKKRARRDVGHVGALDLGHGAGRGGRRERRRRSRHHHGGRGLPHRPGARRLGLTPRRTAPRPSRHSRRSSGRIRGRT
jgi:hypothetical protein